MKAFFTILGICIVGIMADTTDENHANWEANKNACIKQLGIDPVVAEKALNGKTEDDDEKMGCFAACMAKKVGLMNSDGSINESKLRVRGSVKKERAVVIINKCKVMKGADDCETARKILDCMYKEDGW